MVWRGAVMAELRCYFSIFLTEWRKPTKNLSQKNRLSGRDSNRVPPKWKHQRWKLDYFRFSAPYHSTAGKNSAEHRMAGSVPSQNRAFEITRHIEENRTWTERRDSIYKKKYVRDLLNRWLKVSAGVSSGHLATASIYTTSEECTMTFKSAYFVRTLHWLRFSR